MKINAERLAFARAHKWDYPSNLIHETASIDNTAVIGADGFGWVRQEDGTLIQMPHAGCVIIDNDVEVRAFVTIDRGVKDYTLINEGNKIDHHCHIAHNVQLGKHNTLANGCIIEGSCQIGDYNTFGASVIVQRKVKIGNGNIFGSGSVVTKDVGDNCVMVGNPARKLRDV